jgi:hypothetical protein
VYYQCVLGIIYPTTRALKQQNNHIVDCTYVYCTFHPSFLTTEILELDRPEDEIRHKGEGEAKLESDITTEWCLTSVQGNRSNEPDLRHSADHAGDTEAESSDGGNAWRKSLRVVVEFWVVASHALLEEEVVTESDAFVDCKPIARKRISK